MRSESIEQPVILEQPAIWSRVVMWLLVSVTTSAFIWASLAKIEQAVPATGKLEPQGSTKEIKAPTGGVVREIYVNDGQLVKKGELLVTFDPTAPQADVRSLIQLKASLLRENQFYTTAAAGNNSLDNSSDLSALTRLRAALVAENDFLKAQVNGLNPNKRTEGEFDANQQQLLTSARAEYRSRIADANLRIQELEKQLGQTRSQLATARKVTAINQGILDKITPVAEEGGLSQVQYQRQQQEVLTRQSEVDRLDAEQQRLSIQIAQAKEQLQNTVALTAKDVLTKIADNQKKVAEIDTQLGRNKLENEKRIAEIDGELSKANLNLQYQELRSPVDGIVFDLKAKSQGFVANSAEPILKIVPNENLVASVYLTNKDIGFVYPGMETDVKIESFPESEFGSIKGKLVWVGSDALPPTQERPYYAFPAKIQLERQALTVNGKEVPLQSGMGVNSSIKVRKRTVLSMFMNMFDKKIKSLETVR
ncbi:HlyD family efflux transporter periplasmic adaptor subunit [Gloeocapsopsis crepidinum LEGE 06123]|uniref:HlyD family efflux transporter periplasmic adaptor subunit n=2 Tax=Gloeocapsopsis crepidinum TaxID=693223 RepID=A0ABR9UX16_9CHRO|nr:HlyD family efflux transporter periplasmic adaptor subunit [Gloeocapsopsis crepidinum]MBE9192839.1 HlyD family efflux transporter periplasmic adaptor subunit [Gloeocapsopsis crepidinum LEGE 06123]